MDDRMHAGNGASWRRMSVWLARAGYSELEISTVMTVQRIARLHPVPQAPYLAAAPARIAPAPVPILALELTAAAD